MSSRVRPARAALAALVAMHLVQIASAAEPAEQAEPYRDRVIEQSSLEPLPAEEGELEGSELEGQPRSLRVEAMASLSDRGAESQLEHGLMVGGFWQTSDWGDFSVDATVFRRNGDSRDGEGWGGAATLWQRGLHLAGDTGTLDTGLGVLNSPLLDLQRNQFRFFLPSAPLAGLSTQWVSASGDRTLVAAAGRAGTYSGTRLLGFDLADGAVTALGGQWRWNPAWSTSAAFLGTQGRVVPDEDGQGTFLPDRTRGLHLATQWESRRATVQGNVLLSDADAGKASATWLDAQWRRGRYEQQAGLFSLEPGLAWGALPINQDIRGGYYRLASQFARWNWSIGVDDVSSISGLGFDGQYGTGFLRYQVSMRLGVGGSLNLRVGEETASGIQLFADHTHDWGATRWQIDHARSGGDSGDSWLASVDQSFNVQQGRRLSTTLAYGRVANADQPATATGTVAINGAADITDALSLDASVRWTHGVGYSAVRGVDINLAASWRLDRHWSLAATFYQSQGSQRSPFALDPIANQTPFISLPRDRSFWVSLRYARDAGRPQGVLGGAPDAATGAIAGNVFLDENGDGVRGASELPAAGLTVILDGRYSVRTEVDGSYAFPRVAVGSHSLQILPDNLPLPWGLGDNGSRRVEVEVRQTTRLDVAASRPQ